MVTAATLLAQPDIGIQTNAELLDTLQPWLVKTEMSQLDVLRQGNQTIVHCEAPSEDALASFLDQPEVQSALLLDSNDLARRIFAWSDEVEPTQTVRCALNLTLQEGKESEYRRWLGDVDVLETLQTIWRRNGVWRHDVLLTGTTIIAYYEVETMYSVSKAFREPEALKLLLQELSQILVLDPYVPTLTFYSTFHWSRGCSE